MDEVWCILQQRGERKHNSKRGGELIGWLID
jgi:hypothetical protein